MLGGEGENPNHNSVACKKIIVHISEFSYLILNDPLKLENVQKVKPCILNDNPGECLARFSDLVCICFFPYSSATLSVQHKSSGRYLRMASGVRNFHVVFIFYLSFF